MRHKGRAQQQKRQDTVGAEDIQQLGTVETQPRKGLAPVDVVKEVAGNEDEVDGAGVKEALPQAVEQLSGAAVIIKQGIHPDVRQHDAEDGKGPEVVERQVVFLLRHTIPRLR